MFIKHKVLNQLSSYARFENPYKPCNNEALTDLIRNIVKQARISNQTDNYILLAKLTLKLACDEGLIKQTDLTDRGDVVLEYFARQEAEKVSVSEHIFS